MFNLLENDIKAAGGHVRTNGRFYIHSIVPGSYTQRVEPLLRKYNQHINPHYVQWAQNAAVSPPKAGPMLKPTEIRFQVTPKFFQTSNEADNATLMFVLGMTTAALSAIMLIIIKSRTSKKTDNPLESASAPS